MDQSGRGPAAARAAVAAWLTRDWLPTDADQIVLTSGSSVSYHLLFRAIVDRAVWDRDGAGGAPGAPGPPAKSRPDARGGAPEVKAGWITVHGLAAAALVEYLDTLHDAYLTLSAHAAAALEVFLHPDADDARAALATEVMARRARWIDALAAVPWLRVHRTPGGIHLIADVDPALRPELDDEELAVALLDETGVLLHPGYLYDVPEPRRLVATCLAPLDPEVAARRLQDVR